MTLIFEVVLALFLANVAWLGLGVLLDLIRECEGIIWAGMFTAFAIGTAIFFFAVFN